MQEYLIKGVDFEIVMTRALKKDFSGEMKKIHQLEESDKIAINIQKI